MGRCCRRRKDNTQVFEENPIVPIASEGSNGITHIASAPSSGRLTVDSSPDSGQDDQSMIRHVISHKSARGKPFPKRPKGCTLSQEVWDKMELFFRKMDPDGSNAVTREEAQLFFKGAFGTLSADAMFNEVDVDGSGAIDADEFVKFWIHVRKNGYKNEDIDVELDSLMEGGAWVDWEDGKDTSTSLQLNFPKRPILCRLNAETWTKCQRLFEKMDSTQSSAITREDASRHFKGAFSKVSVDAMFNEIDQNHHGRITPKEWMKFWVQVKWSGYAQQEMRDEIEDLMAGSAWVDWKDGRSTA